MKGLFHLTCLLIFFASCKCDDCVIKPPYIQFYIPASDTLLHPLSENDSLKIYIYYKDAKWKMNFLYDSLHFVNLRWYDAELDSKYTGLEKCFVIDQNITPQKKASEFGVYDFWLISKKSDLQIKLSKMTVNSTGTTGNCPCPNYSFGACYVNDSINYTTPVKLW